MLDFVIKSDRIVLLPVKPINFISKNIGSTKFIVIDDINKLFGKYGLSEFEKARYNRIRILDYNSSVEYMLFHNLSVVNFILYSNFDNSEAILKAKDCAKRALSIDPHSAVSHTMVGLISRNLGDMDKAIKTAKLLQKEQNLMSK